MGHKLDFKKVGIKLKLHEFNDNTWYSFFFFFFFFFFPVFNSDTWRDSKRAWKPGTTAAAVAEITARATHASVVNEKIHSASQSQI